MKRILASFGVVASIALFGCSSSDSGGSSVSVAQACTDIANTICSKFNECAPFYVTLAYGDVSTCNARAVPSCSSFPTAPGSTVTAAQIEACSKALQAASCNQVLDQGVNSFPECNIKGTLDNGKACASGLQCASGFCPTPSGSTCGTCAPATNPGDACVSGECSTGLSCVGSAGAAGKCQAVAAAGADCTSSPCGTGYSCVSSKCTADLKQGDTCDPTSGPHCNLAVGLTCQSGTCQPITLPKVGEACGPTTKTGPFCAGGAICSSSSGPGTCIAPAEDGGACNTTTGPGCKPGAECVSNVCKLPDPNSCK